MNYPNIIYQYFNNTKTLLNFPYPPLYKDTDTDYICFSTDASVQSSYWDMIYVDNYNDPIINNMLNKYIQKKQIETNQIQTGSLFNKDFDLYKSLITIPDFSEIPDIEFDVTKLVPTKNAVGNYIYMQNPIYTEGLYDGCSLLLTIGVPVSNQISTIDRCLSHIKPLLDALDSELIVINTGSTDGTLDVCRKYGARIIDFPWCDNMSAARNVGINNARGLWYMSIDDDEWFENVDEILTFFKTGQYKNANTASYIQRNYDTSTGTTYSDACVCRMARITPDLHFEGRIHDALIFDSNIELHTFALGSYAHHYGFVHDNPTVVHRKYKRNVSILLYDLYEYPSDLRYNFQLANEFDTSGQYDNAIAYYFRGLSMDMEIHDDFLAKLHATPLIALAYNQKSKSLFYLLDLFEDKYLFTLAEKAYFYYCRAEIGLYHKHPYDEIFRNYKGYELYRLEFEKDPVIGMQNAYTGLHFCNHPLYINLSHTVAFCACIGLKRTREALNELDVLSADSICSSPIYFFEHLYMDDGYIFEKILTKLSTAQFELKAGAFITGLTKYISSNEVNANILAKTSAILSHFSSKSIDDFFNQYINLETLNLPDIHFTAEAIKLLLNSNSLSVQALYFYSHAFKLRAYRLEGSAGFMDAFLEYVQITMRFINNFYNSLLLQDEPSEAIPAELRAIIFIWRGCNASSVHAMSNLFRKAMTLYPPFISGIKTVLATIDLP